MKPKELFKNNQDFRQVFARLGNIRRGSAAKAAQKRAVEEAEKACTVCRIKPNPPLVRDPMGAHIQPHEEGGSADPNNLVCLCVRERRSLSRDATVDQIGCHDLFDNYQLWTRQAMMELRKSIGTPEYAAKSVKMNDYRTKWAKKMVDPLQLALANRRWARARKIAKQIIKEETIAKDVVEQTMMPDEKVELLCQVLVATRKGYSRNRWDVLGKLLSALKKQFNDRAVSLRTRLRSDYEFGMLLFQLRRFEKSLAMLNKSFVQRIPATYINRAQADVARFECIRRKRPVDKSAREIATVAEELRKTIAKIDLHATNPELNTKDRNSLSAWRIDARLHLARMLASFGKASEAGAVLKKAKQIRGESVVEPSAFSTLMLAEATVTLAERNYCCAVEALGRVGFKLATTGHKDFEQLETVLSLLLQIPQNKAPVLDAERKNVQRLQDRFKKHLDWLHEIELIEVETGSGWHQRGRT